MKNLDQVKSQNSNTALQTQPAKLCHSLGCQQHAGIEQSADQAVKKALSRRGDDKPSTMEAFTFRDIYQDIIRTKFEMEFGNGMAVLQGFYELIQDNPRMKPFSDSLRMMIEGEETLGRLCHEVGRE